MELQPSAEAIPLQLKVLKSQAACRQRVARQITRTDDPGSTAQYRSLSLFPDLSKPSWNPVNLVKGPCPPQRLPCLCFRFGLAGRVRGPGSWSADPRDPAAPGCRKRGPSCHLMALTGGFRRRISAREWGSLRYSAISVCCCRGATAKLCLPVASRLGHFSRGEQGGASD